MKIKNHLSSLTQFSLALAAAALLAGCGDSSGSSGSGTGASSNAPSSSAPSAPAATNAAAKPSASTDMKTTASGLKYSVLKQGTGTVSPKPTDQVTVNYKGTLLNGTQFDSSYDRGQPATFPLNRVIPGWTEGLQLMHEGDKFKFEIPANLAYGAASPSPLIPENSTLVFEVELIKIN